MSSFAFAQIIGFVAVAISLVVFQINRRSTMLKLGAVAAVLYAVSFYLLHAMTGAAMNAIGAMRDATFASIVPGRKRIWIFYTFIIVIGIGTAVTWAGWLSLLPMSASMLNCVCFWRKSTKHIRRLYMLIPPLWFSYNFIVHSYPGMTIECIVFASNLIGQYRFDYAHTKSKRTS